MKNIKVLVGVALITMAVILGLGIWATVATVRYVSQSTTEIVSSPQVRQQVEMVRDRIHQAEFNPRECWLKAQSLMTIQPWIERPLSENVEQLKNQCFNSAVTEGSHDRSEV